MVRNVFITERFFKIEVFLFLKDTSNSGKWTKTMN